VITFAEEYRNYLMENGVEIDEKYFLKDWSGFLQKLFIGACVSVCVASLTYG
jgi:hypothetical protein